MFTIFDIVCDLGQVHGFNFETDKFLDGCSGCLEDFDIDLLQKCLNLMEGIQNNLSKESNIQGKFQQWTIIENQLELLDKKIETLNFQLDKEIGGEMECVYEWIHNFEMVTKVQVKHIVV